MVPWEYFLISYIAEFWFVCSVIPVRLRRADPSLKLQVGKEWLSKTLLKLHLNPIIFLSYMNNMDRVLGCSFLLWYIEHCVIRGGTWFRHSVICLQNGIVYLSVSIYNVSKTFKGTLQLKYSFYIWKISSSWMIHKLKILISTPFTFQKPTPITTYDKKSV